VNKVYATEEDFLRGRKFCAFFISIDDKKLVVEERGEAVIEKDSRNSEMRLLWLGSIKRAALKELQLNSSSLQSFTGYYVDYADNRENARIEAMRVARQKHAQMMTQLDMMLARMQGTELTFIPQSLKCKCNCKCC
jgi:hypothetical protein